MMIKTYGTTIFATLIFMASIASAVAAPQNQNSHAAQSHLSPSQSWPDRDPDPARDAFKNVAVNLSDQNQPELLADTFDQHTDTLRVDNFRWLQNLESTYYLNALRDASPMRYQVIIDQMRLLLVEQTNRLLTQLILTQQALLKDEQGKLPDPVHGSHPTVTPAKATFHHVPPAQFVSPVKVSVAHLSGGDQ